MAILSFIPVFMSYDLPVLTLTDAKSGAIYLTVPVKDQQRFTLGWRHSVELQPWEEDFQINQQTLHFTLVETRFRSYGAGVPALIPGTCTYELSNGFIVFKNLNQDYEKLSFIHSDYARYWLTAGKNTYTLADHMPDSAQVFLRLQKIPLCLYLFHVLSGFWAGSPA
ncbi:MAG: DUF1850 domain-containing protein [Peptococcaceae bacterium]|jgi:hypothetical protein|nr:DUF1850 domain-containing protein [Peptococcaceae bacterium]MDH7525170.1 DUF1850 domain-containing protein [Peptococcaceae bacterium]